MATQRTTLDFITYCWTARQRVERVRDDEWIEYIPAPSVVERDGDLWWRYYSPDIDAMRYVQLTKGDDNAIHDCPSVSDCGLR